MDKLLIKRGSKRALEQLDPLPVGELFLAKDEERLYVGGPRGNISIPSQQEVDEKATKTELQQVSLAYKESYDTLDDLKNAYPNGDVYNHVVLADGMIYTYANGEWISTGVVANGALELMKAYEDLKVLGVGGRNLLTGSDTSTTFDWNSRVFNNEMRKSNNIQFYPDFKEMRGKEITISADIKAEDLVKGTNFWAGFEFSITYDDGTRSFFNFVSQIPEGTYNWTRVYATNRVTDKEISSISGLTILLRDAIGQFFMKNLKVEFGNKATDWTPAPEDINAHPFVVELVEIVFRSKQNE